MDIEVLIREVKARAPIWDQKCTQYYNRDVVTKMWKEVAKACGMPSEAVRCKWKHLRDNYRKEFKKSLKGGERTGGSCWVWFGSLGFLGQQLNHKRIAGKRFKVKTEGDVDAAFPEGATAVPDAEEDGSQFVLSDGDRSPSLFLASNGGDVSVGQKQFLETLKLVNKSSRKRCHYDSAEESDPDCVEEDRSSKERLLLRREPDDTHHFLLSLRGPLRSLPFHRQMFVRFKMQELIFNETVQSSSIDNSIPYPVELKSHNITAIASLHTNSDCSSNGESCT